MTEQKRQANWKQRAEAAEARLASLESARKIWADAKAHRDRSDKSGKCNCPVCKRDFNAFLDSAEEQSMSLAYAEDKLAEAEAERDQLREWLQSNTGDGSVINVPLADYVKSLVEDYQLEIRALASKSDQQEG